MPVKALHKPLFRVSIAERFQPVNLFAVSRFDFGKI